MGREGVQQEWHVTWDCRDSDGRSRQRKQHGQRYERLRKEAFHITGRKRVCAAKGKRDPVLVSSDLVWFGSCQLDTS